ncbi:hypothetical protein [Mycobacterium sp. 852013-50091_SCH5140682]|nr:hypothetical protein [Mycobacterium sp. 852013-50091_SCH5140682]
MSEPRQPAEPDRWHTRPELPSMWQEVVSAGPALVAAGWRWLRRTVADK